MWALRVKVQAALTGQERNRCLGTTRHITTRGARARLVPFLFRGVYIATTPLASEFSRPFGQCDAVTLFPGLPATMASRFVRSNATQHQRLCKIVQADAFARRKVTVSSDTSRFQAPTVRRT